MFDLTDFVFQSRRSPVLSQRGMVAASQPLAVAAGLEILTQGGNAADAAVATAAALNVAEPTSTGIGGDCFALYYEASSGQVYGLNGSGRAPAALTLERLVKEGFSQSWPPNHPYTITVPGACAAWCDLIDRFGRLPLENVLSPAIRLAEQGFPVAPLTAHYWQKGVDEQLRFALNGLELTIDGRAPHPGEVFRNPGLGRAFRKIAENGKSAFYHAEIAQAIVSVIQKAGGCLSEADLGEHHSEWQQPISVPYRGLRVWECPPNGQGLAALLALNILEGFDLISLEPLSSQRLHLEIEAMRLAFADAGWFVADPDFNPFPLEQLLSKEYAAERRRLINPKRTTLSQSPGLPPAGVDTVYFCVVDKDGNGCSFINSNYMGFGTGIVPAGWGFSLQNRGHNFSLDPLHPNALAPHKRPYHTIIPGLITRELNTPNAVDLFATFGVMGGFMQPQGHVQVVIALGDDGLDPQSTLDLPRFCIPDGKPNGMLALEEGISTATVEELTSLGHTVEIISGYRRSLFGRGQIIVRDPTNGTLWGASDPRADGCAMGI